MVLVKSSALAIPGTVTGLATSWPDLLVALYVLVLTNPHVSGHAHLVM